ncbi:hypothetical protein D9M71_716050 [compost metagenome]
MHTVALGGSGQRTNRHATAVRHAWPGFLGHQYAAFLGLVFGQLGPIVRHVRAMAIRQRVAFGQQFGSRRGALVDRFAHLVFPVRQAEFGQRGVVGLRPSQARDIAQVVGFFIDDARITHRLVVRHPVPERRFRRGATGAAGFFQDDHVIAQPT